MVNRKDSKTYSIRNLKFVSTLIFLAIFTVIILLYLLSLNTFLPFNVNNQYNWVNILTFLFLILTLIFSIAVLFSYLLLRVFLQKEDSRYLKIFCIKWGLLFTIGFTLVLLLNFLHILNIYWGVGILIVVILTSFVI